MHIDESQFLLRLHCIQTSQHHHQGKMNKINWTKLSDNFSFILYMKTSKRLNMKLIYQWKWSNETKKQNKKHYDILVFIKHRKIFPRKIFNLFPNMVGWGQRKFAMQSLTWHFLVLLRYHTQQYKQNLTNLNFVCGYSSITHVFDRIWNVDRKNVIYAQTFF